MRVRPVFFLILFAMSSSLCRPVPALGCAPEGGFHYVDEEEKPGPERKAFGNYAVLFYRYPSETACFEILKDGRRVYEENAEGGAYSLYVQDDAGNGKLKFESVPLGKDITGDGEPDLVVREWTGGMHCCILLHLFQIGKRFQKIQTIDTEEAHEGVGFANLDPDPALEFVMLDGTFAYWQTSFTGSAFPEVILDFRDGQYRLAPDLMRKAPPSIGDIQKRADALRASEEWRDRGNDIANRYVVPSELWTYMLELIYTGQPDLAWKFYDLAWPPEKPGKAAFSKAFRERLSRSPYGRELQGDTPPRSTEGGP